MTELQESPAGAQHYIDGMFWKINSSDRVLRHNGFEWVSSTRSKINLQREARKNIHNEFE